jgi:subtilisin family serine protease
MANETEYVVVVHKDVNLEEFDAELAASTGEGPIPNREVKVANPRWGSKRMTHWMLTDAEVNLLKTDERVLTVEIPADQRTDITIGLHATQTGIWYRGASTNSDHKNWGLRRVIAEANSGIFDNATTLTGDYTHQLTGTGVDFIVQDSGIQADHPEFYMSDTTEYVSGALASDATNGAVFDRSLTVRGVKLVAAGAVGGATTVPDEWVKKTAQAVKLLIDPNGDSIDITQQKNLIATLKGDAGTTHAGTPTAQRIGYGGESSYSPNWLLDAGIPSYAGYQTFLDSHAVNDMVFYHGTPGDLNPSTSDRDIEETMEHLFHTIHNFGIPGAVEGSATQVPMETLLLILNGNPSFSWTTTELHLAMKEAIDAGLYDPSGYSTDWATDPDEATKVYKEYTYLVNWSMWDMSEFWAGESLSPEWDDTLKTPAGMSANNPLGYAMFNKYFAPVLSKPDFNILKRIYQDGDAGVSGYAAQPSASRVQEIDWFSGSGIVGETQDANFYTDYDGHGTHCAGIAAGKSFGWAKNARVYAQKLGGLEGTSDPNSGISITNSFDTIRLWHANKSGASANRPTVVNMSWGYGATRTGDPTSGTYRGTAWTYGVDYNTRAELEAATGVNQSRTSSGGAPACRISVRTASVDAEIEDMVDAGIHVVIAAGNNYNKIDTAAGADYANEVLWGATYTYHRGSSPYSLNAYMVASIDSSVSASNQDKPSIFSSRGPGCNIWAPGSDIMSATSTNYNTLKFAPVTYDDDATFYQMSISGTSMAAPQVAGLLCLHLQVFPDMSPSDLKDRIVDDAKSVVNDTGADNDYGEISNSRMGQTNKILYSKYNTANPWTLSGPSNISIGS